MVKERLDVLLTVRRLAESRERAKTTIMAGLVLVDGQKVDKAGTMVKTDADIRLLGDALPYVSRGGWKLAKALDTFGISLTGRTSVLPRGDLRTVLCKTERLRYMPLMWAMASWHGSCALMTGWSTWNGSTSAM